MTSTMHQMGIDILTDTLPDDLLEHGIAFYGSDLGRRLVAAENDSTWKKRTASRLKRARPSSKACAGSTPSCLRYSND